MILLKSIFNFFSNIGLYLIIIILVFALLFTNNFIFFKVNDLSIEIGITDRYDRMNLDEQLEETRKVLEDKELDNILKDARKRGYLDD